MKYGVIRTLRLRLPLYACTIRSVCLLYMIFYIGGLYFGGVLEILEHICDKNEYHIRAQRTRLP